MLVSPSDAPGEQVHIYDALDMRASIDLTKCDSNEEKKIVGLNLKELWQSQNSRLGHSNL